MKGTIHVTNWSSKRLHGLGRKLTIMAKPRAWERGDGRVDAFTPHVDDLAAVRAAGMGSVTAVAAYMQRCDIMFRERIAAEPDIRATTTQGYGPLLDGDTLCCGCSRENAAKGLCHRVLAARILRELGWRVLLDGVEVTS